MRDWLAITGTLRSWLLRHEINPEDVTIVLRFKDRNMAYRAEGGIRHDFHPVMGWPNVDQPTTINGMRLELEVSPSSDTSVLRP